MNLSEKSVYKTLNFSLLNLCMWLFSRQRRKFPRMSLFHTSTLGVTLHYKQMHPRRGLVQLYFRTRNPSCLHLGALTGAREELPEPGEGMLSNNLGYGEISIIFSMENISRLRLIRSLLLPSTRNTW